MSILGIGAGTSSIISYNNRELFSPGDHYKSQDLVIPPKSVFKLDTRQLLKMHRKQTRYNRSQLNRHNESGSNSIAKLLSFNENEITLPIIQTPKND